jgi:hypothetical protein
MTEQAAEGSVGSSTRSAHTRGNDLHHERWRGASRELNCVARDHDALLVHLDESLLHHVVNQLTSALIIKYLLLGFSKLCLQLFDALELLL